MTNEQAKAIPAPAITCDLVRDLFTYDESDGSFRYRVSRGCVKAGGVGGHKGASGYIRICINGKYYMGHRVAWLYVHGAWPALQIDHINRIKDDNRICNLREVSFVENRHNWGLTKRSKHGCAGIHWDARREKWHVQIGFNGKKKGLGSFKNLSDAIDCRKAAELRYHPSKPRQEIPE